jgi:hypothetical protein
MTELKWGFEFQEQVYNFLREKFGNGRNKRVGLPDIQIEVKGCMLNLEVTSGKGIWWKILDYTLRGVPLHAIVVRTKPEYLRLQIATLKKELKKLGRDYTPIPILEFNEELPQRLIRIANKLKKNESYFSMLSISFMSLWILHSLAHFV